MAVKVLIKGSIPTLEEFKALYPGKNDQDFTNYKNSFIAASEALGVALARAGHTMMVGVPEWKPLKTGLTVAPYVVQGASQVKSEKGHKVIFYAPQDPDEPDTTPEVDTLRELNNLPNVSLEERFLGKGPWSAAMIPDVQEADTVILLGGGEGTASIGYAAYSLNKPIVAITWFNGAAQAISDNLLFNDYVRNQARYHITSAELRSLQAEWFPKGSPEDKLTANFESATHVISLATRLVKEYVASNRRAQAILWLTVGYLVAFVLLWLAIFLTELPISSEVRFFALLFFSSILGVGLRTLVAYQERRISQLSYLELGVDLAIALIVAFGLALIYLIGGISFTGTVVVLNAAEDTTFANIAISMSLLGLAAGFLVPLKQLQERLEKIVSSEPQTNTPATQ